LSFPFGFSSLVLVVVDVTSAVVVDARGRVVVVAGAVVVGIVLWNSASTAVLGAEGRSRSWAELRNPRAMTIVTMLPATHALAARPLLWPVRIALALGSRAASGSTGGSSDVAMSAALAKRWSESGCSARHGRRQRRIHLGWAAATSGASIIVIGGSAAGLSASNGGVRR
jgi:hypothetical protein